MATPSQDQLDAAKALLPLMEKMADAADEASQALGEQLDAMREMVKISKQLSDSPGMGAGISETSESVRELIDDLEDLNSESATSSSKLEEIGESAGKAEKKLGLFGKAALYATSFGRGFWQGLKMTGSILRSVTGLIGGAIGSIYRLGKSILAIPFKLFNILGNMASQGGSNELAEQIEKLRDHFGALGQTAPQAVLSTAKEMRGFAATGLSAYRIFGNMAERLQHLNELSQKMGPVFQSFTEEFKKSGGALLGYQKGLGLTDEAMRTFGERAKTMGGTLEGELNSVYKQVDALGAQFNIATKDISRDLQKAAADVKHFGGATIKQMATASVYARKLGLELDKIVGTLDTFETFEGAAENVSKLSQSFGIQADAFKLMEMQDPAQQVDYLRKQFAAAGVDASKFNRQQLKLLSSTTGLDEATARQAFSLKNQGVSLDKISSASAKAEKKQVSQAEAMNNLADAMKRMIKSGSAEEGSFLDRFFRGIARGVMAGKEFRQVMMNLRIAFRTVLLEGVRLGRAIAQMPAVKEFFGGIAEFFNPARFKALVGGVTGELIKFVKGEQSFPVMMENIKKRFFDHFDASSGAGQKFLSGVKRLFQGAMTLAADAIRWIAEKMAIGVKILIGLLQGKGLDLSGLAGGGFWGEALAPLFAAFKDAWKTLSPVVGELLSLIGDKLMNWLDMTVLPFLEEKAPILAAALLGPAFIKAGLAVLAEQVGPGILKGFRRLLPTWLGGLPKVIPPVPPIPPIPTGPPLPPAPDSVAAVAAAKALGLKLVAIAGALAVGGVALAIAIWAMKGILGDMTLEQAELPLYIIGAVALASLPLMGALALGSAIPPSQIFLGGLAIAAALGIGGLIGAGVIALMGTISKEHADKAVSAMWAATQILLMAVPVGLAAAAMGAMVPFLLLGLIGFPVMSEVLEEMSDAIINIMTALDKVKMGADIGAKVDAFVKILTAVTEFTNVMVEVMEATAPSLDSLLFGGRSFEEQIADSTAIMGALIGEPGGGGIIGIMETITEALSSMAQFPGIETAATVFKDVLTAVTAAVQGLMPPEDLLEEIIDDPEDAAKMIAKTKDFVDIMSTQMTDLMASVKGTVAEFIKMAVPNPEQAKVVAEIVAATASLLNAVAPSPQLIESFKTHLKEDGTFTDLDMSFLNITQMKDFITEYIGAVTPLIKTLASGMITEILAAVKDVPVEQLSKLSGVADILKVVVDLVKAINDTSKGEDIKVDAGGYNNTVIVTKQIPDVIGIIDKIGDKFGILVGKLKTAAEQIPNDDGFFKRVDAMKKLFEMLASIPQLVNAMKEVPPVQTMSGGPASMMERFEQIQTFLHDITASSTLASIIASVNEIGKLLLADKVTMKNVENLKNFSTNIKETIDAFKDISNEQKSLEGLDVAGTFYKFNNILVSLVSGYGPSVGKGVLEELNKTLASKALGQLGALAANMKSYSTKMSAVAKATTEGNMADAMTAVVVMIDSAKALHTSLTTLPDINLDPKLKALASGIGLGGKFNYKITNERVQINIDLAVAMDAGDVEAAIIMRSQSIIRDRVNAATAGNTVTFEEPIPPRRTKGFQVPGKYTK